MLSRCLSSLSLFVFERKEVALLGYARLNVENSSHVS